MIMLNGARIRKVKCDEKRPLCQKCVNTGRACDGYELPFRYINNTHSSSIKSDMALRPIPRISTQITLQDIDLLNRYFSTKTIFEVKLGCEEEARQVLQASLTHPPIRHAVLSLRALREDFEASGDCPPSGSRQNPSYDYGIQQYCTALRGLATSLSFAGSGGLRSTLLCCQIFISIEQVRENYTAMGQHIIRGLGIMHEYGARPQFVAADKLAPAHNNQLPLLDVFIIKLFAAPCKFGDAPATLDTSGSALSSCPIAPHQQPVESRALRTIAPNMRTKLKRIAESTLEFLCKVSRVKSVKIALHLLSKKAALLDSLESWLIDLNLLQTETAAEPTAVSFMRLFHAILKIVLLGALESSSDIKAALRTESNRLQGLANHVGESVKEYRTWRRSINIGGEDETKQTAEAGYNQ